MSTAITSAPEEILAEPRSLSDLIRGLGGIPLSRILAKPAPGTATESDVLDAARRYNRLYELVDGALVEKVMGYSESLFALFVARILLDFVEPRNLGLVSGADGSLKLFGGLVRIPDVAFVSWDRLPGRVIPKEPIPSLTPDLVVEVLSESNTPAEMERKRGEYFTSGVRTVWEFDTESRILSVFTSDGNVSVLDSSEILQGGDVLPGFTLVLADLFAKLDQRG
jgi:Uma2 family endonuclease